VKSSRIRIFFVEHLHLTMAHTQNPYTPWNGLSESNLPKFPTCAENQTLFNDQFSARVMLALPLVDHSRKVINDVQDLGIGGLSTVTVDNPYAPWLGPLNSGQNLPLNDDHFLTQVILPIAMNDATNDSQDTSSAEQNTDEDC